MCVCVHTHAPRPRHRHLPDVGDKEPAGVALLLIGELEVRVRFGQGGECLLLLVVLLGTYVVGEWIKRVPPCFCLVLFGFCFLLMIVRRGVDVYIYRQTDTSIQSTNPSTKKNRTYHACPVAPAAGAGSKGGTLAAVPALPRAAA